MEGRTNCRPAAAFVQPQIFSDRHVSDFGFLDLGESEIDNRIISDVFVLDSDFESEVINPNTGSVPSGASGC